MAASDLKYQITDIIPAGTNLEVHVTWFYVDEVDQEWPDDVTGLAVYANGVPRTKKKSQPRTVLIDSFSLANTATNQEILAAITARKVGVIAELEKPKNTHPLIGQTG